MLFMGVLTGVGFVVATLFLALFLYNIISVLITLGFLVEIFEVNQAREAMALAFVRSLQRGLPLLLVLGALLRAILVGYAQNADLKRKLAASDSDDLVIDPVLDRSPSARMLRVVDYLPLTAIHFYFEASYPQAYLKSSPYAFAVAAILALIAKKKALEPELVPSEVASLLPEPCDPLVLREALRLTSACDLLQEKVSINAQGREVRLLRLSERGQLLVKRFDLVPVPET